MSLKQIKLAQTTLEDVKSGKMLPLNLQLFASGDGADGDSGNDSGNDGGNGDGADKGDKGDKNGEGDKSNSQLSTEALDKLIQARADKITAELGKEKAKLQKELDKLKKDKLTDEEIKNLEIADKEKALTEKEQALLERENRLYAMKAIKENELDDGSSQSLELIDFVMGKDETEIDTRVKAFKSLVDRFVSSKVEQTFKANGRVPNGGGKGSNKDNENNIAAELGKARAEATKKSNEILDYYLGGKK